MNDRVHGERVFLRAPLAGDADELLALMEQSWRFLAPWLPARETVVDPLQSMRERLEFERASWIDDRAYRFMLCASESGALIGRVALNNVCRGVLQGTDIGYWLGEKHARKGLASEGVRLALDVAFGAAGLHRVQAGIIPRNAPSVRLVEKIGFRREGLAKRFVKIAGEWEDHWIYALTADEWPRPMR